MMILLMLSGYQLSMQEAIKRLEKLRELKTEKMSGKSQEKDTIGLQEHVLDYYDNFVLYYML